MDDRSGVDALELELAARRAGTRRIVTTVGGVALAVWVALVVVGVALPDDGAGWEVLDGAVGAVAGTAFGVAVGSLLLNRWEDYKQDQGEVERRLDAAIVAQRAATDWARRHAETALLAAASFQDELAEVVTVAYAVAAPGLPALVGADPVVETHLGASVRLDADADAREGLLAEARAHIAEVTQWASSLNTRVGAAHVRAMGPVGPGADLDALSTQELIDAAEQFVAAPPTAASASDFDDEPWEVLDALRARAVDATGPITAAVAQVSEASRRLLELAVEPHATVLGEAVLRSVGAANRWEELTREIAERPPSTVDQPVERWDLTGDAVTTFRLIEELLDAADSALAAIRRSQAEIDEAARWDDVGQLGPQLRASFAAHRRSTIELLDAADRRHRQRQAAHRERRKALLDADPDDDGSDGSGTANRPAT